MKPMNLFLMQILLCAGLFFAVACSGDDPVTPPPPAPVKTVTVGAQNGTLTAGTAGTVTFPVTTANIANGNYGAVVSGLPTGVTVSGSVTINANAGTLRLTGTPVTAATLANLTLTIDGTTSPNFTLTVASAPNQPPTCSITAPANGATYTAAATISVSVIAQDSDGAVTEVKLFVDNVERGITTAAPYNFTIDAGTLPAGSHTLKAVAKDNQGATGMSAVVTINIKVVSLAVGMSYQGGIIAYVDALGEHGLIAAPTNISAGTATTFQWYNGVSYIEIGTTATAIGTGQANTTKIVNAQGDYVYAAKLCKDYRGGGYDDWFLPSIDELTLLYQNRTLIGGFATGNYWSSSEYTRYSAWIQNFHDGGGNQDNNSKNSTNWVRAVRYF